MIYENENATMGLPVYLLVAIIISSIIFAIFALAIFNMYQDAQVDLVAAELEKISCEAENMFEYADAGTLVIVHVDFPDSLSFIVFGSLPENGILEPTSRLLNEDMSNSYYFVMDDGTIKTYSSNARFSAKSTNEIAVIYPGSYDLSIELVKNGDLSYVSIY